MSTNAQQIPYRKGVKTMKTGLVGNHYIEYTDSYKEIQFVVLFNSSGWRTAYVDVTNTFLEKLDYTECDNYIDVHGGFTYKDCRLPFEPEEPTEYTWLGWDYAHYGDGIDCDTALKLFGNNKYSYTVFKSFKESNMFSGHLYTLEEVITACKYVIDEIRKRGVK